MIDLYATLGVVRNATSAQIKRAYQLLASKLHPDRNKEADAHERFVAVQKAYEVLSDADARAHYDHTGQTKPVDNTEAQARDVLTRAFLDLANQADWRPWPYVKRIREVLREERRKAEEAIRLANGKAERLNKALPNAAGTDNLFAGAVYEAQRKLNAEKENAASAIRQIDAALELIKDYSDTVQEPAQVVPQFYSSSTFTNGTSWR